MPLAEALSTVKPLFIFGMYLIEHAFNGFSPPLTSYQCLSSILSDIPGEDIVDIRHLCPYQIFFLVQTLATHFHLRYYSDTYPNVLNSD